jgi:hypothetical protein
MRSSTPFYAGGLLTSSATVGEGAFLLPVACKAFMSIRAPAKALRESHFTQ